MKNKYFSFCIENNGRYYSATADGRKLAHIRSFNHNVIDVAGHETRKEAEKVAKLANILAHIQGTYFDPSALYQDEADTTF